MIQFTSAAHETKRQGGFGELYLLTTANLNPATVSVRVKLK
jgi:hypothetical protein